MSMGDSLSSIGTLLFDMDNTLFDLEGAQAASCCEVARFLGTMMAGPYTIISSGRSGVLSRMRISGII